MAACLPMPESQAFRGQWNGYGRFWRSSRRPPCWCPGGAIPHPDHRATTALPPRYHRATAALVLAALAGLPHPPRRLEYMVWAWERAAPADLPTPTDQVRGFRLDVSAGVELKQRAIAAHRSQLAPGVFTDDPNGFLLAPAMLAHFAGPYEVYFEAAPPATTP